MKYYKFKHLLFILPILLIIAGFLLFSESVSLGFKTQANVKTANITGPSVTINQTVITVEIADEANEQFQGLSDRENLSLDSGMLFIFPDMQKRTFVMRRMHFPLDIIWIKDNKIIGISENLPPEGENPTEFYNSPEQANYVLEVNGGFCDENDIKVGDSIIFNL